MGRPFTLTRPRSHCELDAVMSRTMTPNPYEAPACQQVKRSLREAFGLAHGSSDRDLACCAPLT